jgi:prepilin-type N-terminal cleavage/methylation domain-containing protein
MKSRAGFTLVEILLSALLVGVVAMIVHTLYRTVLLVRATQAGPVSREETLTGLLAALGRDLAGGVRVNEEKIPFELKKEPAEFSQLRLPVLRSSGSEVDGFWSTPSLVEYRVDPDGGSRLLRISRPLSGPGAGGPFTTNEVLRGVSLFRVEALSGEEWKTDWKSGPESAWPIACRVRIAGDGGPASAQEMILEVPSALSVSSSIERH